MSESYKNLIDIINKKEIEENVWFFKLNSTPIIEGITNNAKPVILALKTKYNIHPKLLIVRDTEEYDAISYENSIKKRAEKLEILVEVLKVNNYEEKKEIISEANDNNTIHGILRLDSKNSVNKQDSILENIIKVKKDVDAKSYNFTNDAYIPCC